MSDETRSAKLWLVTINVDAMAPGFSPSVGCRQVAAHAAVVREGRSLTPDLPGLSPDDIPIGDGIEFELFLSAA